MTTFISLLRGINLGGQKKILMADLTELYEKQGFTNVKTYIQSGNVIFNTDHQADIKDLEQRIEQAIEAQYGFAVPVQIRTNEALNKIITENPFLNQADIDLNKLHITFLAETPTASLLEKINTYNYPPDSFKIINQAVYLHCPIDYGHSKLSNSFFESKLKVKATTRNWKTVNKLAELAL